MHSRFALGWLASSVLSVALPASAAAQDIPSPFRYVETRQEVGIFVGSSSISQGRFGFGPDGGTLLGARWGIDLSGPLGLEAVAGAISGSRDVVNPARVEGDRVVGEADALIGTVDARLRFTLTGDRTWHGMAPFLLAGGGIAFDLSGSDPDDEELEAQDRFDFGTSFFGTLGGGVRVFLNERIALRGDGVFSLWKLETPPGFSDPERGFESVEESQWVNGLHLTLSTVIRF